MLYYRIVEMYSLEIARQIPGRDILTALPHPSTVRLGQIIFSGKLPVITVADHYHWPYHSETRSRVLDSLLNLERYPVYKRTRTPGGEEDLARAIFFFFFFQFSLDFFEAEDDDHCFRHSGHARSAWIARIFNRERASDFSVKVADVLAFS